MASGNPNIKKAHEAAIAKYLQILILNNNPTDPISNINATVPAM
jgi:hypothetical protein